MGFGTIFVLCLGAKLAKRANKEPIYDFWLWRFLNKVKPLDTASRKKSEITFIDLFAGIGGIHIAFENAGALCVFASEKDPAARRTYTEYFKRKNPNLFLEGATASDLPNFNSDITEITDLLKSGVDPLPKFDILTAGFPCQPFSHAGLRKGMEEARGTLFFDILSILRAKLDSPHPVQAFFLENVRGLMNHRSGDELTIDIIERNLLDLGYTFQKFLVRASDYGVPQYRPRVFMIGFLDHGAAARFEIPQKVMLPPNSLERILGGKVDRTIGYTLRVGGRGSGVGDRRNWDTYLVDGKPFRIGPTEGLSLQGFPQDFVFPSEVSPVQQMKQLGNSVAIPAVQAFAGSILRALKG